MFQYKRVLLVLTAGVALLAGKVWADNATPAATPKAVPTAVSKAPKAESPNVTAMKAANALEDAGNTADAIAAYEKIGVLKSKSMEAWRLNNEALAYLKADNNDKAVSLLEKAVATNDANYVAWNNLGTGYEGLDKLEKARDAYQKSIDAAKAASASSAKAEGNLANLQPRLDKLANKEGANPAETPATAPAAGGKK